MSNYGLGTDFERRCFAALAKDGYFVVRSAGSHGIADLVALKPGQILLVQCKRDGEILREEWNELVKLAQRMDPRAGTRGHRVVVPLLAYMPSARGIAYRELLHQLEHRERRRHAWRRWTPDEKERTHDKRRAAGLDRAQEAS